MGPDSIASMGTSAPAEAGVSRLNLEVWTRGRFMRTYAHRQLRPVEVIVLARYREDFAGHVLELGCGAGRIAGYLCQLSERAYGIDLSEAMIRECRRRYPDGSFTTGDLRDLSAWADGSLGAVVAGCNVLDVFTDVERRATLAEIRRVLAPGGLLVMSAHNRAYLPKVRGPLQLRTSDPARFAYDLLRAPLHWSRHRRLVAYQRQTEDYAIVSDGAHSYSLVHYFIEPGAQRRQLEEVGFDPVEVLDLEGRALAEDDDAPDCVEIHYVARRR